MTDAPDMTDMTDTLEMERCDIRRLAVVLHEMDRTDDVPGTNRSFQLIRSFLEDIDCHPARAALPASGALPAALALDKCDACRKRYGQLERRHPESLKALQDLLDRRVALRQARPPAPRLVVIEPDAHGRGPAPPAVAPSDPLLQISGLGSHYGRIAALRGVDLVVGRQQLVALVGANGAGKTTLLRTISGVQKATAGRIVYDGEDITKLRADRRVRLGIGHVPEGRRVFGSLSVADNLRLGAYCSHDRRQTAEDLDCMYGMFPILKQRARLPAGTLSGGQQQMLAIARALMGRPRLLVLDEPSMGLAPRLVEDVFATIGELRKQAITILLVEQNAHAALAIADEAHVIETGEIVLSGSGRALLDDERVREAYLGI